MLHLSEHLLDRGGAERALRLQPRRHRQVCHLWRRVSHEKVGWLLTKLDPIFHYLFCVRTGVAHTVDLFTICSAVRDSNPISYLANLIRWKISWHRPRCKNKPLRENYIESLTTFMTIVSRFFLLTFVIGECRLIEFSFIGWKKNLASTGETLFGHSLLDVCTIRLREALSLICFHDSFLYSFPDFRFTSKITPRRSAASVISATRWAMSHDFSKPIKCLNFQSRESTLL